MRRAFVLCALLLTLLVPPTWTQAGAMPVATPDGLVAPHSWPNWQYSPGNNAYNYQEHILNAHNINHLKMHALQTQKFGSGWNAVLGDGVLFESALPYSTDASLAAIDVVTNTFLWRRSHTAAPLVTFGHTVVAQDLGSCQLPPHLAPLIHTTLHARPADCVGRVFTALDTHTGAVQWQVTTASGEVFCCQAPIYARGLLYTGITGAFPRLEAIDGATGQIVWTTPMTQGVGLWAYGDYRGHAVLYATEGEALTAVDAQTGARYWSWPLPDQQAGEQRLIFADQQLYLATTTVITTGNNIGEMYAFNNRGTLKWQVQTSTNGWFTPSAEANGIIAGQQWYYACGIGGRCGYYNDQNALYSAKTGGTISGQFCSEGSADGYAGEPVIANGLLFSGIIADGPWGEVIICQINGKGSAILSSHGLAQAEEPLVVDGRVYSGGRGTSSGVYWSLQ